MYLQALEMENFKSFKGRVRIPYERGFTATTGPNGSGKSNCGDAIQFVLGARSSKALRAQNVKDLLFNGGKRHKAAKSCEVSLEFANPPGPDGQRRLGVDTDVVRFTRRIRLRAKGSVDSAYELDGRPSSQTEFRRLLEAAGMRSDGYNIVLQGDVTSLATMGPVPRRRVLDEIAGVTAYDDELRKADRQRADVAEFLERIALMEEELTVRLAELEHERDQAMRYRTLHEDLESARRTLLFADHRGRVEELHLLQDERTAQVEKRSEAKERQQELAADQLGIDERLVQVERQLDALLGEDHERLLQQERALQLSVDRASDRIGDAEREAADDEATSVKLHEELTAATETLVAHLDALKQAAGTLKQAHADLAEAERSEQAARAALDAGDEAMRDLNRALGQANEAEATATAAAAAAQLEYDRAQQGLEMATERLGTSETEQSTHRLRLDELEMELEELEDAAPVDDRQALATEWQQLQTSERKLVEEQQMLERRLRDTSRALDLARDKMERSSGSRGGVAQAVQGILQLRDSGEIRGILGTVAELAAPHDPSHEAALATAAGGGLQSIIVQDDSVAQQCIEWLRRMKGGRATFLPLNKLATHRPGGKAVMVARQGGVVGFAHELLHYDPRIETAIRYVFRDTLIVDALATARRHMGGVRMVTLGGDVIEAGGAMQGGSPSRVRGTFSGRPPGMDEVERLQAELASTQLKVDTVEAAIKQLRLTQQDLRQRIASIGTDEGADRRRTLERDLEDARARLTGADLEVQRLTAAVREAEAQVAAAEAVLLEANGGLELAREGRLSANEALRDATPEHLAEQLRAAERLRLDAERQQLAAQAALDGGQDRTDLHEQSVARCEAAIGDLVTKGAERAAAVTGWAEQRERDKLQLDRIQAALADVSDEAKDLQEARLSLTEERTELKGQLQQLEQRIDALGRRIDELGELAAAKRAQLEEVVADLADQHLVPPADDEPLPTVDNAQRTVRRLEQKVEALGAVNMLSIDQYDQVADRLQHLSTDRTELVERRQHLLDLAERLEAERVTRLHAVLEDVSRNFQAVYARLSDGGRAELRLEKPDDPFSGGLEMWAQPSGKSSKTRLEALSGGEKSMVALALIFAIQRFEPSPFYYLDEVDQNLDSENAERIARLCREISQHSQFIMVTLRKVSLQLADHHIGVTHAGDGCSRLIAGFDRDRAIELGEAAYNEAQSQMDGLRERAERMAELPSAATMPRAPEELGVPGSLGGLPHGALGEHHDEALAELAGAGDGTDAGASEELGEEAGVEVGAPAVDAVTPEIVAKDATLGGLADRAADLAADIAEDEAERGELEAALAAAEAAEKAAAAADAEDAETTPLETED